MDDGMASLGIDLILQPSRPQNTLFFLTKYNVQLIPFSCHFIVKMIKGMAD
jgi:hypothetical protein